MFFLSENNGCFPWELTSDLLVQYHNLGSCRVWGFAVWTAGFQMERL